MTVKEYIIGKFSIFGITFSDADFADISLKVNLSDIFSDDNRIEVLRQLAVCVIPQLLLRPKSVSENGFTITSFDVNSLMKYYAWLCAETGLEDKLSSSITDITDTW